MSKFHHHTLIPISCRTCCNRKLLLQPYKSLIYSQQDYSASIYSQLCKSLLKLLNIFQTFVLRFALGALHSSCAPNRPTPSAIQMSSLQNFLPTYCASQMGPDRGPRRATHTSSRTLPLTNVWETLFPYSPPNWPSLTPIFLLLPSSCLNPKTNFNLNLSHLSYLYKTPILPILSFTASIYFFTPQHPSQQQYLSFAYWSYQFLGPRPGWTSTKTVSALPYNFWLFAHLYQRAQKLLLLSNFHLLVRILHHSVL